MTDKGATAVSYGASIVAGMAGLTINEWIAIAGFFIGAASFGVNVWYKKESLSLERRKLSNSEAACKHKFSSKN
jgi:hypothetical protein